MHRMQDVKRLWVTCFGLWALCFGAAAAMDAGDAPAQPVDAETLVCVAP